MSIKQWNKIIFQKNDENYIESCQTVREQFHEVLMSSDYPAKMALFCREEDSKTETYYFSPDCNRYAKTLLLELSTIPCDQPNHVGLMLLEGTTSSRVNIFGKTAAIEMPDLRK